MNEKYQAKLQEARNIINSAKNDRDLVNAFSIMMTVQGGNADTIKMIDLVYSEFINKRIELS